MAAERLQRVVDFYLLAKGIVIDEGFGSEIAWQNEVRLAKLNETAFLREAAWVVLSSGMRETVIRGKFPAFSQAFHNWTSAEQISDGAEDCRQRALRVFAHRGKVDSIIDIAGRIVREGFDSFKNKIDSEGVVFLQSLPFIGPATSFHLAKNVGLDVVKPDRHLVRVCALAGYKTPTDFCEEISNIVGDRLAVVDLVVWRYATINPGYRDFLTRYLQ